MDKFITKHSVENSKIEEISFFDLKSINNDLKIDKKEIKMIREFIEKRMNNSQKVQIVDIIKKSSAKYTLNKNGYFINMNNIPHDILIKIKMFVDFTKDNARELQKTEELLSEEKNRIEGIDKIEEDNTFAVGEESIEKNINFEVFSLDSVQTELFNEYKEDNKDEIEFCSKMVLSEKRENSGYKIILKKYKKKYIGNKAKVLKKFRDISRSSMNSKSAKTTLNQGTIKTNKVKSKKIIKLTKEDAINNPDIEETIADDDFSEDDEDEILLDED